MEEMEQGSLGTSGVGAQEHPGEREPFPAVQARDRSVCEARGPSQLWHETEASRAVAPVPCPSLVTQGRREKDCRLNWRQKLEQIEKYPIVAEEGMAYVRPPRTMMPTHSRHLHALLRHGP